jgi:SPP1 family predicted phage head-tail adaptor
MEAGRLRHRINIERRVNSQDPETGAVTPAWLAFARNVPAAIEPLSAREFIAGQAMQSEVTTRIVIRHRPGLDAAMRIKHGRKIYNPAGFLGDKDSGLEYVTIPCSLGVSDE